MSLSGFLDTLRERGFIEQTTDEAALEKLFSAGGDTVSAYIGSVSYTHLTLPTILLV